MSIAEQIMLGTQQQSKNWSVLSDSLGKLGQQIGNQLATREYQKQAAEALPAMQAAYRSAMDDVVAGETATGYKKFMDAQFQFGTSQNPFIAQANAQAGSIFENAIAVREKQEQRLAQYGGGGGEMGGGMGGNLPAMNRRAVAENLLSGGQEEDYLATGVDAQQDGTQLDATLYGENFPLPDEDAIPTQEVDNSAMLNAIAENAQSPQLKQVLQSTAKNPPPESLRKALAERVNQYNQRSIDELNTLEENFTKTFNNKDEIKSAFKKGSGYQEIEAAEDIIGIGTTGIALKPTEQITSVSISGKGVPSTQHKLNTEELGKISDMITASVSELAIDPKTRKFFKESGGYKNIGITTEEKETEGGKIPVTYFIDKTNPNRKIEIPADFVKGKATALADLQNTVAKIATINDLGAQASLVRIKKQVGPTREAAKKLPALKQPAQRPPIRSFFERK